MPIKAAEYSIGFDTQAAKASWVELEKSIQDGSVNVKDAVSGMSAIFNQMTNVQRTGKKEVDAFTGFVKEQKQEVRTLGFVMRNAGESVAALSETFGGPRGLGKAVGDTYGRFDQIKFALEGLTVAGQKAGGQFAKVAGVLGGVAVPAGIGLAAFSLMKDEFEKEVEQVKSLSGQIRLLKAELGQINSTKLHEINREMLELSKKAPDVDFFTQMSQVTPGIYANLWGLSAGLLELEKDKLGVLKAQREELERIRAQHLQLLNVSQEETQGLFALKAARLAYDQSNKPQSIESMQDPSALRVENMREQSALLKDQISGQYDYLRQQIEQGASLKDTLSMELALVTLLKQRKDLEFQISNEEARALVYVSEKDKTTGKSYLSALASIDFLKNAAKEYKSLHAMDDRNAPKRIISQVIEPAEGMVRWKDTMKTAEDEYGAFAVRAGDILAQNLSSGFMRGFTAGKFLLSDFTNAMLADILAMAAQEAAIDIVAGLGSLIFGGSFAGIAGALGSHLFSKPKAGSRVSSGGFSGAGGDVIESLSMYSNGSARAAGDSSMGTLISAVREVTMETREVRHQVRQSRMAVYVGGVVSPDTIVSENLLKAERRRARRMK